MHISLGTIGLVSHLVAAIAFAMLGFAVVLKRAPTGFRLAVALASFLTVLWAAAMAMAAAHGPASVPLLNQTETLRTAAWVGVLLILQRRSLGLSDKPSSSFVVALGVGFVVALALALDIGMRFAAEPSPIVAMLFIAIRLVLSISGLVLLHNLYVNTADAAGISFRLFAVGLGIIFAYDLNFYTLQFLNGVISEGLLGMRGAVNALAVPLIYLGLRSDVGGRFVLSRRAAFHTVSFSIIGIYLIAMSVLAYGLRLTGGDWGALLQIGFLVVTLAAGALVVLSPRFRAELKVRIARNFYRYRYDYRVEWLRFIDMIDSKAGAQNASPFRERLIESVATVMECPGGALMEPDGDGGFRKTQRWRWPELLGLPHIPPGSPIIDFLKQSGRVVEFDRLRAEGLGLATRGSHNGLAVPQWAAADRSIWLAIPLVHREQLTGILFLQRSLAVKDLNWEDFDLLRTLGRQGASYLAEAETQAQLDEARSFDEFNRRFAFVMHDVKNLVSQLALVARNAERHADKPAFRADMVTTLNSSVAKMTDLLNLMSGQAGATAGGDDSQADVARVVTVVVAALRRQRSGVELAGADMPLAVRGDAGRLEAMLTHIVQNALDASAPDTRVLVGLEASGGSARITVRDHGHGMSQAFIHDELFKPFRSTKEGGFGIGAFEAREIARAHGGRLEVASRAGEGTIFTIILPLAPGLQGTTQEMGTNPL